MSPGLYTDSYVYLYMLMDLYISQSADNCVVASIDIGVNQVLARKQSHL